MFGALLDRRLATAISSPVKHIRPLSRTAIHRSTESDQPKPEQDTAGPSRSNVTERVDPPFKSFETGVPRAYGHIDSSDLRGLGGERGDTESTGLSLDASEDAAMKSLGARFSSSGIFGGRPKEEYPEDLTKSFGGDRTSKRDRLAFGSRSRPDTPKSKPFNSFDSLQDLEEINFVNSPRPNSSRAFKGVHDRHRRHLGAAPREAQAFDEILQDMFKDLGAGGSLGVGNVGSGIGGAVGDPFGLGIGGVGTGRGGILGGGSRKRLFSREETEADQEVLGEVDKLKEEMSSINDEVRLLAWAKATVFTPKSVDEFGPTFSRAYSRILAHLLKTVRENFDNPHLALALFQHAQTHSLESYLSGCLAPTYNELLLVRWESFRDFEGVKQGVREMQMNGVPWDRGTQKIVGTVVSAIMSEVAASGGKSRYGQDIGERLRILDELVQGDIDKQEDIWNKQRVVKSQIRKSGGFGAGNRNEGVEQIREREREATSWVD